MSNFAMSMCAGAELLCRRPLESLKIAWWWITGRRVRASNRFRAALVVRPDVYGTWLWLNRPPLRGRGTSGIRLAIHVHVRPGQEKTECIAVLSALQQLGEGDSLYVSAARPLPRKLLRRIAKNDHAHVIARDLTNKLLAIRYILDTADADYLLPLDAEATFTPGALDGLARTIEAQAGGACVFYADQDAYDLRGRRNEPWFKPKWDQDLFLAQDYASAACAIPIALAKRIEFDARCPDDVAVYALLERLQHHTELPPQHVPLVAVTVARDSWRHVSASRLEVVRAVSGVPVSHGPFGTLVVHRPLPQPAPLVSVIVPTRDRLDLLETCVRGVLQETSYPNLELLIADNGSIEPATLTFLKEVQREPRVKVVEWPQPYNYSAINNFAVARSDGEYLCLLNNDIEVLAGDWLSQLMTHAVRPDVGAVGARLLYPDGTIQHAGVVVGMGNAAGHAHRGLPAGNPGYFAQALVTREATALTGACLVVAREKFDAVGGLDEARLAIAYNDIDFCLKLRAAGWRNIYAAEAVLIHHEGKSRGRDLAPEHLSRYVQELKVFQERWGTVGYQDPTHHPALDIASEIYRLKL